MSRERIGAELCRRVRTAYDGPLAWHDRIWAAGWAAMRFLLEEPERAGAFLAEVNGGDPGSRARREVLLRELAELIDPGRDELGEETPVPATRCTAEATAGALLQTLVTRVEAGAIEAGEDFLPELVYIAVIPYLGASVAEDELLVQPLR